jgi:hypothetical protein
MPKLTITIAPVILRTSRGDGWFVHGLAIGAGTGLDSAVMELETEAERHARELARELEDSGPSDAEWAFRVEDVRITGGPAGCVGRGMGGLWHLDLLGPDTMVSGPLGSNA